MIDDYDAEEPQTKPSSAFIVVFLLHVVAISGIYLFNSIKSARKDQERRPVRGPGPGGRQARRVSPAGAVEPVNNVAPSARPFPASVLPASPSSASTPETLCR